ncbi:hypothetical protein [Rhodococcus sp. NCIMB 12038]|uniref:hypothetical protein n=1 Tax=Rhodococcus sp. NCIMB 12038 TaxID=933800 RepID=UPI0015C65A94|nr:hypothetical protein [Rhodococcus sp. NCIMB 12038]
MTADIECANPTRLVEFGVDEPFLLKHAKRLPDSGSGLMPKTRASSACLSEVPGGSVLSRISARKCLCSSIVVVR